MSQTRSTRMVNLFCILGTWDGVTRPERLHRNHGGDPSDWWVWNQSRGMWHFRGEPIPEDEASRLTFSVAWQDKSAEVLGLLRQQHRGFLAFEPVKVTPPKRKAAKVAANERAELTKG